MKVAHSNPVVGEILQPGSLRQTCSLAAPLQKEVDWQSLVDAYPRKTNSQEPQSQTGLDPQFGAALVADCVPVAAPVPSNTMRQSVVIVLSNAESLAAERHEERRGNV